MATMERAGDDAPPNGIPRPQWLVRFFDEDGTLIAGRRFFDPVSVELCATRTLGKSLGGRVACLARFFVTDGNGWVTTGEELEYCHGSAAGLARLVSSILTRALPARVLDTGKDSCHDYRIGTGASSTMKGGQ